MVFKNGVKNTQDAAYNGDNLNFIKNCVDGYNELKYLNFNVNVAGLHNMSNYLLIILADFEKDQLSTRPLE